MPKTYLDANGNPIAPPPQGKAYLDPETGEPLAPAVSSPKTLPPLNVTPAQATDMFKAGVQSKILGVTPGQAYENKDEIDKQLREKGGDYDGELDDTVMNDIKVGLENSVAGLYHRQKLPEQVKSPGLVDRFISGVSELVANYPVMWVGGAAGKYLGGAVGAVAGSEEPGGGNIAGAAIGEGVGGSMGAFALPAVLREALVLHIKNGNIKGFGDLMRRTADIYWEGTKGATVGALTELAGGLPVGKLASKIPLAPNVLKGLYQATAMVTAGDLLDGRLPKAKDFAGSAALIVPLNLITHGTPLRGEDAETATQDVYVKTGKPPQETAETLKAQPPVKPDLPEGLRPAIQRPDGTFVEGEQGETHADVAQRVLAKTPFELADLEGDKEYVATGLDEILQNPIIHEQSVIDKAWQLKKEEVEAGEFTSTAQDFPNSKVQGTVFHGTSKNFEDFDTSLSKDAGVWFTPNKDATRMYSGGNGRTIPARVNLENPYEAEVGQSREETIDKAVDGGHDGIIVRNKDGEISSVAVFDSKNIKQEEKPLAIEDLYDRASMKSGSGFVTPDGQFKTRTEARAWMKENEPDVHEMWLQEQGGDKQAELHSEDYGIARMRVQNRNLAEGDPVVDALPPDLKAFLAEARSTGGILNKIKAGLSSKGYGFEAIRTLLVGPRNMFRAEGAQIVGRLRKLVPDEVDQQVLHFARDYRGEITALNSAIEEVRAGDNEKLKQFLPAMERAASWGDKLPKKIADADAEMTDYFTKQLALGRQLGTLESGVDPSRYSPRFFMKAMDEAQANRGVGRPQFTDKSVNAIRRDYIHTLDPLQSGDTEARTFNALDEMSIYSDRMAVANSTAIFKTELKNSALGMAADEDNHPKGWVPLTKQFMGTRPVIDGKTGKLERVPQNFYVPKDVADALAPLLEGGGQLSQVAKFLHVQQVIKSIELTLSAFHIKALNITAFNNLGLKDWITSIHSDNNSPENEAIERRAALYDLETTKTGVPFDAYTGLKANKGEPTGLARLTDNAVVEKADAAAKAITKFTFDVVQRKWKVMDWAKKEASWIAKHPNATESEYATAMRGYSKEVNAAYGGLNWDVMGVSKGLRDVSRLFLLAPDWTFSNVANLKYALTDGGTAGAASRSFFLKSFVSGIAATAAASIYFGGKYNPDAKHFDQVYLGKDKDGKEMYANWFFAGAPKDAMNLYKRVWADGPAGLFEVVLGKASPLLSTLIGLGENKQPTGAPIWKQGDSRGKKTLKQGGFAAEKVAPISVPDAVKTLWDAAKNKDLSYKDVLNIAADLVGSPTVHYGSAAGGKTSPGKAGKPPGAGVSPLGVRHASRRAP